MEDKDLGLGKCVEPGCIRWAVVGLNGNAVCLDHFSAGLQAVSDVMRRVIR